MKVVAYGDPSGQQGLAASLQGLAALGAEVVNRPSRCGPRYYPADCTFAVMEGIRSWHRDIWLAYRKARIPIVLIEYGYLARASSPDDHAEKFWQVSVNKLGWAPSDDCDASRFDALNITPAPWRKGDKLKPVLVCGDHPGGIDETDDFRWPQIRYWALTALEQIRKATARRVFWRPHPAFPAMITGFNGLSVGPVNWSDYHAAVVYNSNTGNEALLGGCAVFSDGGAAYTRISGRDLKDIEKPILADRAKLFRQISWAQWTLAEIRQGKPFAEYLKRGWIK